MSFDHVDQHTRRVLLALVVAMMFGAAVLYGMTGDRPAPAAASSHCLHHHPDHHGSAGGRTTHHFNSHYNHEWWRGYGSLFEFYDGEHLCS